MSYTSKYTGQEIDNRLDEVSNKANQSDLINLQNTKLNISDLLDKVYPVGSLYLSSNGTSPASLFGGTWVQIKDRFLLGAGDTYSNGATGGQSTISLTVSDLPGGTMVFDNTAKTTGWSCGAWSNVHGQSADWYAMPKSQTSNQTYTYPTNMPPYFAVYMWRRVA